MIEDEINFLSKVEGLSIDEARLTYKARQKLPNSAFCGPNRTYPAHDAAHVRNALARLARFGHRLPKSVRAKILACLKRRAKKFGVEVSESYRWNDDGSVNPKYKKRVNETVSWFLNKHQLNDEAFWIQKAIQHKGALRKQLGIKEGEIIPESLLRKIINTETGKTINYKGKTIRVTTQLKRRAILALRLRHMPKRGRK